MKKFRKYIFCSIFIILMILFIDYFTPEIYHEVYNGIKYRLGDKEYEEVVTVKLDGEYIKKSFFKNEFKGTIHINDDKLTNVDIIWNKGKKGSIDYWIDNSFYSYGTIYASKNLEELTICVYESNNINKATKHWSSSEGLMISVPAKNRKEALLISNYLMSKDLINKEDNIVILK